MLRWPKIDAELELMIGNAVADAYTPLQTITGPRNSPYVTRTRIGWAIWNLVRGTPSEQEEFNVHRTDVATIQEMEELKKLEKMVKSYIDLDFPERVIDDKPELSQEDKRFLEKVPDLSNSLLGVLLRFRQERVAVMSDIEAMFHQVKVPQDDCDCLRFYWWPNGDLNRDPAVYKMVVHLFGAVSSPEYNRGQSSLEIINTILKNFYVDDCLKSVNSEEKAITLVQELVDACQNGGFHLTKWISNSRAVIESIPINERASEVKPLNLLYDDLPTERALGVYWSAEEDTLGCITIVKARPVNRRGILSIVSPVYDPLGLVGPFILPAKILLQDLCYHKIGWDQAILPAQAKRWQQWLSDLKQLEKFKVERCYKPAGFGEVKSYQLHNFSDASEKGYGTVTYLRITNAQGQVHCCLVMGKSRVSPLKKTTIPRMELTAAALAVRINRRLQQELDYPIDETFFWTDSMSVLRYCANETTRFKTFVANRVTVIREGSETAHLRYIDTKSNPADYVSRGLTAHELLQNRIWTQGPAFLWKHEDEWPENAVISKCLPDDDSEIKGNVNVSMVDESTTTMSKLIAHTSSWIKLRKMVGWILIGMKNLQSWASQRKELRENMKKLEPDAIKREILVNERMKQTKYKAMLQSKKNIKINTFLPAEVLEKAERAIIGYVQRQHFAQEIESVQNNQPIKKSSPIYRLDPIMKDGLLRIGGRLSHAMLPYEVKHPMLLPRGSLVSTLILQDIHRQVGHLGRNSMLDKLRQKYWILQANTAVRQIISRCTICRRYRAQVGEQMMADLPKDRLISNEPPFTRTGVDFFGPIEVKRGRTTVKRYGVVFTCLNMRAIHLEVAYSLDTNSFINALRRFIARRGQVKVLRSDNGTNLVGAERELREAINNWNQVKIGTALGQKNITWQFNPPSGSHFGGIWERQIRTIRKVLFSLLKEQW
ncbi:uncharacterized protein [Ptychodera flava]|uniref:uncharacterized protein n=1 Tax=Ptychodera flava TaxID=63121 RepID=UPI00396A703D